ncbi:MAG: TetR/AcrR family transcriptional regulator [Pyrinomonadaceae bacterium]|nr:TetR/AcrR family transcriptional regulator [Pyrinomonadaceae bacterium]
MRRELRGEKTRKSILSKTVDIASAEGLNGLTVGRVAKDLNMSKSGLFSHFGSKEELQLSTVEAAREIFEREVIKPARDEEDGLIKLYAFLNAWVSYVEQSVFQGGCFFFAASAEMDDRPGRVRDYIAESTIEWVEILKKQARLAVRLGELKESCDVDLLVFQLHGSVQEANWFFRLHDEKSAFKWARTSVLQSLELRATKTGLEILSTIE